MVRKLRVGVFCPTFNVYGGAEVVAGVIANTLAQNNYDVTLFTNEEINQREIKKFFGKSLNPSIKAIVKPSIVQPRGLLDFYQTILRSYIFKLKCNLWIDVYSNRVFPWTNVSYIHFPFLNHYSYKPRFPYLKSINVLPVGGLPQAFFEKNFTGYEDKLVLANSQYTADEIRSFSGKKAEVLYPPVPSIIFNDNPHARPPNKNQRKNLVVTVSRFGPDKELEKIPYIASMTEPTIQFAIVGRVHYQSTLLSVRKITQKLGLEDRIKLFPDASKPEMNRILRDAKIYLHTMIGEQFGISIIEAMAMGCIPIVHDSGGPKEFVPKDFRYRTIREAATNITKEIGEWSPRKALKVARIAGNFREENFSNEFMKLFRRYIAHCAPEFVIG
jgi:glycosyltransferase involved in cell wall biosynthesis